MSNKQNQIEQAQQVRNTMSMRLMDTRAILTAIEALLANSVIGFDGDEGCPGNAIHPLIILALEKAREADFLADDLEGCLLDIRRAA